MATRSKLDYFFISVFVIGGVGVALSIFQMAGLKPSDGATLFAGLIASAIVWWQGHLIKQQMQLQAILDLVKEFKEWDSPGMQAQRRSAWNDRNEVDKDKVEGVLEFLERVSTLAKRRVISVDLIWDTLGWYVWRYAHYCSQAIDELRSYWTPDHSDLTLYCHLQELKERLLELEIRRRKDLTKETVVDELAKTREDFVRSEKERG